MTARTHTRNYTILTDAIGITCNTICPAWVLTPLAAQQVEAKASQLGKSFQEAAETEFLTDMPTRRFVDPSEVAAGVLFLCSDLAKSITGHALPVDGGSLVV